MSSSTSSGAKSSTWMTNPSHKVRNLAGKREKTCRARTSRSAKEGALTERQASGSAMGLSGIVRASRSPPPPYPLPPPTLPSPASGGGKGGGKGEGREGGHAH